MLRRRSLHRWLGLLVGAWLVWLGLTGSMLALAGPLREVIHPHWFFVPKRSACPWELRRQQLQKRFPDQAVRRWEAATGPGRSERVLLGPDLAVYLDPGDGRVLGQERPSESLPGLALRLHTFAEPVLPYVALLSAVTLLSGYVLQPFRRRQWARTGRPLDWHRRAGWVSLMPLLASLLTGALLVKYNVCETWLRGGSGAAVPRATTSRVTSLDSLLHAALQAVPRASVVRCEFPRQPGEPFTVRLRQAGEPNPKGRTFVHLEPSTGSLLLVEDPFREPRPVQLLQGTYRVHAGYYPFGGPILGLLGLCPAVMWWTGVKMRSRRVSALRGLDTSRRGARPAQGVDIVDSTQCLHPGQKKQSPRADSQTRNDKFTNS